jgi:DHA2 family multidrug resistance protein-like MFS transporter
VASGVLNTARQLGTALGVAVLGSIGATVARNDWSSFAARLPAAIQARTQALAPLVVLGQGGSIGALAGQLLGPRAAALASSHALDAFCHGMQQAFAAGAAVAVAAAGVAGAGLAFRSRHDAYRLTTGVPRQTSAAEQGEPADRHA